MLADTLSRAALTTTSTSTTVHHMNALKHKPISDMCLDELRCATEQDNMMQILASTIDNGWPEKVEDVDSCIKIILMSVIPLLHVMAFF